MAAIAEMFADCDSSAQRFERFEQYKAALSASIQRHDNGTDRFIPKSAIYKGAGSAQSLAEKVAALSQNSVLAKSLSPEDQASIASELDAIKSMASDLNKDWTFAGPSNVQLVPYDLEAGAKKLWPKSTPIRNSTARVKGVGSARQFKRLVGLTNLGLGGVADVSPFMNSETVQTSFGSLALRRGAKIAYAADQSTVPYVEMGYSDQVNWKSYFAGLGFDDVRQLSQTALLWSHLVGEEKAMLKARGTQTGFIGAISAPTSVTAVGASTGGSIAAGTYYVKVTCQGGFGESVASTEVNTGALTGSTNKITITVGGEPAGATGNYNLYVGTSSGAETFVQSFYGNSVVLTTQPATGGAAVPSSDSSADANGFDGWLPAVANPANGAYFSRLNANLATSGAPGQEFQTAFLAMWNLVYADPDEVWTTATIRNALGNILVASGSSAYRINMADSGGKVLGEMVTGLVNQSSPDGKMLDLHVHPYMPAGNALIRSRALPFPDSEVGETTQMVMVQDYMSVDWPQIQYTYDQSTYTFGTMVHYAPKWNGLITGITN